MQHISQSKRSALLWFLVGLISAPSLLFVASQSRYNNHIPPNDTHLLATLIGFLVYAYLVWRAFQLFRQFGARSFDWNSQRENMFPTFKRLVVQELISNLLWQSDDAIAAFLNRVNVYEIGYLPVYMSDIEEITYIVILLATLPLAIMLLRTYFDFVQGWAASAASLLQNFKPSTATPTGAEQPQTTDTTPETTSFKYIAESAIFRCQLRGYMSGAMIAVTLFASFALFSFVVQTSSTRRAIQLIEQIEATPIALSTQYFDITKNLSAVAESIDPRAPVIVDENGRPASLSFKNTNGEQLEIRKYLRDTIQTLQTVSQTEGEISAEAQDFLFMLSDLRNAIQNASKTNWDTILVRTAIILLTLVIVRIFHRAMISAQDQQHLWEEKLAALSLLRVETLTTENLESFLKVAHSAAPSAGGAAQADAASAALAAELKPIVDQLKDLLPNKA